MGLAQILIKNAVFTNLNLRSKEEVIAKLAMALEAEGCVKHSYCQSVLTREESLPTGIPLGEVNAAIPHTDVEHVNHVAVGIATLAQPVIFKNMVDPEESLPVKVVFLLAVNEAHAQIELLQEVSAVLQDADLIRDILVCQSPEEVVKLLNGNHSQEVIL